MNIIVDVIGPIALYLPYALFLFGVYGINGEMHCYASSAGFPAHPIFGSISENLSRNDYIVLVDVTNSFTSAIYFGAAIFFLHIVSGIILLIQVRKQIILSSETDMMQLSCKCFFGLISLSQIIYALVMRRSLEGRICSGDNLPDDTWNILLTNKEDQAMYPYLIQEGVLLYVQPVVTLILSPLNCCLQLGLTPFLIRKITKERELKL